jgi:hypothetical protein
MRQINSKFDFPKAFTFSNCSQISHRFLLVARQLTQINMYFKATALFGVCSFNKNGLFPISVCVNKNFIRICGHAMFLNEILGKALHFKSEKISFASHQHSAAYRITERSEMSAHQISIRNCTSANSPHEKKGLTTCADAF